MERSHSMRGGGGAGRTTCTKTPSYVRTYVCSSAVSVDLTLSATLQSLYCTIVYACVCVRVGSMLVLAAVLIWCVCVCMRACWKHAGVGRCVDMVCMRVWSVQVSGSV